MKLDICQTVTATCCYLARLAAGSSNGLTNTVPDAVRMCSFELLIRDGNPRLKHAERLTEINKLRNVASYWLYCANILAMYGPMNGKNRRLTTNNMTLGRVRIMYIPPSCIQFHSKK